MKKNKLDRKWIRISWSCNNNCIFCHDRDVKKKGFVSLKSIKKQLEEAKREGFKRVVISGGEASIHSDFIPAIKYSKKIGFNHIQVITNGRIFAYKKLFKESIKAGLDEITFSFHGHNAKLHDKQTRIKGSFEQSLLGLKQAFLEDNLIISVDIVVNKINYRYIKNIVKYFFSLGVMEFDLLYVIPFGSAWKNRKKVLLDIKKTSPYLEKTFEFAFTNDIKLWTNRMPTELLEGWEGLIQDSIKIYDEVLEHKIMFTNFVNDKNNLFCFPERCEYCYLKFFCGDLVKLKKEGFIYSKKTPECLKNKSKKTKKIFKIEDFDLVEFTDFFIKYRFFVKSVKCKECGYDKICDGAHINTIRKKGFKCLSLINKK